MIDILIAFSSTIIKKNQSPNVKERKKNLVFMSLSPLNRAIAVAEKHAMTNFTS